MVTPVERLAKILDEVGRTLDPDRQPDQCLRNFEGEPATEAWVITAGSSMSDLTPPSDSASVKIRVDSQMAMARSRADFPPRAIGTNDTIPPPARIWRAAQAACGCAGAAREARIGQPLDVIASGEETPHPTFRVVAAHPQRQGAQAPERKEAVERPGYTGVLEEPQPVCDGRVARHGDAKDRVAVAREVFRRRVEDDVRARSRGRWRTGVAKVLSTTTSGRGRPRSVRAGPRRCRRCRRP